MRFLILPLILAVGISAKTPGVPENATRTFVDRLNLSTFKSNIKGLTQFGDRMQGTKRNRDAIDWIAVSRIEITVECLQVNAGLSQFNPYSPNVIP